jgi:DNA-binding winged helix-turn-helix (wHTH) protein/Flp pilus assembly protein TadD
VSRRDTEESERSSAPRTSLGDGPHPASRMCRFGEFLLDPWRRTLSRGNSPVSLTSKAFDVLVFLVQNPNRLVSKEELLQAVWEDTLVEEGNLAQYISHLRKALGDNAEDPRWIVTIARKGYQFAGDVVPSDGADIAEQGKSEVRLTGRQPLDLGTPTEEAVANKAKLWRKDVVRAREFASWLFAAGGLLTVVALSVWRYEIYRRHITLASTDTIVLADIENRTGDPVLDGALNNALRYEMEQTPYLNVLGLDKTYASMAQLRLPPTTKITSEIARRICSQTNSKMVISDSIADAGNRYHLEIRALDCETGETLAEEWTEIAVRDQVVHELGATASRLRRKLGEPAESLAQFNQPLERATSASLEALQTGAEGTKLFLSGNPQAALPMYQRGIELDPDLALTYEGIGAANAVLGHYDLAAAAMTRAYQLRDRMTQKDRLNAEYLYFTNVTGELDKAQPVLHRALALFPRAVFFHNNLAYVTARLGEPTRAADLENETARLEPSPLYFSWAALSNINANRLTEARSWLDQAKAAKFESRELTMQRLRLAFIERDRVTQGKIFADEARGPNQGFFLHVSSKFEAARGHFESAERLRLQASRLSSDPDDVSMALVLSALQNAEGGRIVQALNEENLALQKTRNHNQTMILALSLARSGKTEEASRLADKVDREAPLDTTVQKYLLPTLRAAVKLQNHDPDATIDVLRGTVRYELALGESFGSLYPAYIRGLAYLERHDGQSAAPEFQKLIDNPGLCWEFITGPLARLQLGRAQRLMGDNASARKSYEEFLNIWKDADPDLPIYRQAKAEYAELRTSLNRTD